MNKTIKLLVCVLVIIIGVGYSVFNKKEALDIIPKNKPVKIGVILPLSGSAQSLGEAGKNTIELALSSLPEEVKNKIKVIYEDDQLDTKLTVAAVQKLINVDKVSVVITYSSASSIAASYLAEEKKTPLIGVGISKDINMNKTWAVRFLPSPEGQTDALERLILRDRYKKVAIVWNQADGPKAAHDALIKLLPEKGYEIIADESVGKTENDFRTALTKIKFKKPDTLICAVFPQVGIFAKQVKDLDWDVPIVGYINFESENVMKTAEGRLDNQLFVANDNVEFLDKYYVKYKTYPAIADDHLYDAIIQVAKSVNDGKTSKEEILKFLKNDFKGVAGEYKYLGDGSFDVPLVLKAWKDGKFKKIE